MEKTDLLKDTIRQIEKAFGKGSIMKLGEKVNEKIEVISTGSLSLDIALGVLGYPKGRIIEIYGPESSGKTTFALHAIASCQKNGGMAAFIDAEHALDADYAKNLGVDIDNLLLSQPNSGEQALDIVEALIKSGSVDIIVVDSVAALVPEAELNGDMGDSHVGLHARLMSQAMRKLSGYIYKTNCIVIFINQIREKVGIIFGSPESTTGGRALKYFSSIRIDIRKSESIKDGNNLIGNKVIAKVVKNKVAPPFKTAEVEITYGKGICKLSEIIDMAVNFELIEKSGSWFSYNDTRIGQGKESVKKYLEENISIMDEIENKILEKIKNS